jgi:hypothetical protein
MLGLPGQHLTGSSGESREEEKELQPAVAA